jgi:nucleoside-diphosphate-sugar epimerase
VISCSVLLLSLLNCRMAGLYQTVKKWLAEDVYDTRRFEEAYGFQTKTSLEDGLKREVDWYRRNKHDD